MIFFDLKFYIKYYKVWFVSREFEKNNIEKKILGREIVFVLLKF